MTKRPVPLACAATMCALLVAGCAGNQDPPPTSAKVESSKTPAPLQTIPLDPQEAHEQAAIETWEGYISAINTYLQGGDYTNEALAASGIVSFESPGVVRTVPTGQNGAEFTQLMDNGAFQEGEILTRAERVVLYIPGGNPAYGATSEAATAAAAVAGFDRAVIEACYDASAARYVDARGVQVAIGHAGFVVTATMDTQPKADGSDSWIISDISNDWDRPC